MVAAKAGNSVRRVKSYIYITAAATDYHCTSCVFSLFKRAEIDSAGL